MRHPCSIIRSAICSLLAAIGLAQVGPADQAVSKLPTPFETIQSSKQFNAARFGPGNTFSIVNTPDDFRLNEIAISPDGHWLAMGFGSGRIELWNLGTKQKVSEFKSGIGAPNVMRFYSPGNQLIIAAQSGKLAFLDLPQGKKRRGWTVPLGKYKYDIAEIALDEQGTWLAYADEENGQVLDLKADPPKQIADLKDAYSLALSQDGKELWTVNRHELVRFSTDDWHESGRWQLKSPPIATSEPLIRTGIGQDGKQTVAVPTSEGLILYTEPEMIAQYATDKPTSAVAFARASTTYVNISGVISFVNTLGKAACSMAYGGRAHYAVSEDGRWLALVQSEHVNLWRIEDLLHDCPISK